VTIERSQQLGRLLMGASGLGLAFFLVGIVRRSYIVLAVPVAILAGAAAGLTFWVGYTMATTRWEPDDFADLDESESEDAPPPESIDTDYGLRP
jgi:hypothetical protein